MEADQAPTSTSSRTVSSLVGAPLAVLQPGGGHALCVAAVVERSGDASVLVGGATVSRLSGRGRGALCAAAVSAATGILLASKTFVLGSNQADSAEVATWLAGLPEGTVVAVAAGGGNGGPANDPTLDAGLTEALAGLAGDVGPDSPRDSTPGDAESESKSKSRVFTLVGWKGSGQREWARCRHRAAGDGGGRCAVYAELLLTPPDRTADHVAGPKQVELQDKLCLRPLRSAPGDETLACPARGVCRREGEPTVSVGPTVDLVDCPGWKTVLRAPQEVAAADDGAGNEPTCPAATAWMMTSVYPAVGETHEDTEEFDDGPVG